MTEALILIAGFAITGGAYGFAQAKWSFARWLSVAVLGLLLIAAGVTNLPLDISVSSLGWAWLIPFFGGYLIGSKIGFDSIQQFSPVLEAKTYPFDIVIEGHEDCEFCAGFCQTSSALTPEDA